MDFTYFMVCENATNEVSKLSDYTFGRKNYIQWKRKLVEEAEDLLKPQTTGINKKNAR